MNTLLQWFVTSSVLIVAVLILRRLLGRRISPRVRYALWGVVLVRLLLPVQIPVSAFPSAAELVSQPAALTQTSVPLLPTTYSMEEVEAGQVPELFRNSEGQLHTTGSAGTVKPSADGTQAVVTPVWLSPAQLLLGIWGTGAVALGLVLLGSNLRFFAKIRRIRRPVSLPQCPLPVYLADGLPSPCLFGLFRPAIYLTPEVPDLPEEQQRHILTHELTHFRQKDHIWSALRCLALTLHWYNPLVWVAVVLSKQDGELSCDAGAIKLLGETQRIPYGRTLVALVARRGPRPGDLLSCSTTMAQNKKAIQARISQIAHRPETRKTALFAAASLLALAAVFTFGGTQSTSEEYAAFRTQIQNAQSIYYTPPATSSTLYPDDIVDTDLLAEAKTRLEGAQDLTTPAPQIPWDEVIPSTASFTLVTEEGESSYRLCPFEGKTYVVTPALLWEETYTPVAVFSEDADVISTALASLSQQQGQRGPTPFRVEYPEFKSVLTDLFLGDDECVARNDTPEYDMEEWLTLYTSFYEVFYGTPWWLEGAPEGWYARAMDAGSWYTISIPDHLAEEVQAVCEEQAQYPSLDTVYSALENADTIYYAPTNTSTLRGKIQDPDVLQQITQLLLTSTGDFARQYDPGRVTLGEEVGVLTIPVNEEQQLSLCLQEGEDGCLLSCVWTVDSWFIDEDSLPVLWVLPAGTAQDIQSIYENWQGDEVKTASATAP